MRALFNISIIIAFLLVTFFGLGPVLMADGSMGERILTLLVVICLYLFLGFVIFKFRKNKGIRK